MHSVQAAAQVEAMRLEQQGLRKELESAEEDKQTLQQRLLDSDIPAPRHACCQAQRRMSGQAEPKSAHGAFVSLE